MIVTLAGGVGAARMLSGLAAAFDPAHLAAIVNVADDDRLHGLAISPDLDTVTYTLAGAIDPDRGWGLRSETWQAIESLRAYGTANGDPELGWFSLGDQDLGTHLYRTTRLAAGVPLSTVTGEIARRWGVGVRLIPVTDDRLATVIEPVGGGELTFQEYFVRSHHDIDVAAIRFVGADTARPAPGTVELLATAEVVVIAPSNPIVSIGPILAVPGMRAAVEAARDRTVAVSPIVGGRALKGPADRLLASLGHEPSAVGVARLYRDLAAVLVIDEVDAALAPAVEAAGMQCVVTSTVMSTPEIAAALARTTVRSITERER
ncbi:MAG: 2-phospho-L-lactate transferase [Actinobacteria bacterium]|nr:2-phospho-L-lactate transferase [Actinomycetota bacterium]